MTLYKNVTGFSIVSFAIYPVMITFQLNFEQKYALYTAFFELLG
jgi:hypothetical protein